MRIPISPYQRQVEPTNPSPPPMARVVPLTGLRDLGEAVGNFAERYQHEADKTRAAEKWSAAELEWAKAEQEAQGAYDPSKGGSHVEPLAKSFDTWMDRTLRTAASNGERSMLRERFLMLRSPTLRNAIAYESGANKAYRLQSIDNTLDARIATSMLDPSRGFDLLGQQLAEINGSDQLAPVERIARAQEAKHRIAGATLNAVAEKNPGAVQSHPLFKYLSPEGVQVVMKRAASVDQLTRSQGAADVIMAQRLPLDEAMSLIERDHEGEDEKTIKAEVLSRYSYAEKARTDRESEVYGTAQLEVEKAGRVTPGTWARLTDTHRAAILNRQQAEARARRAEAAGRPVKTDYSLYLDLRQQAIEQPEKFARLDLKQYVDRIGGAQLEQLVDLKAKTSAEPKSLREATTLTQQMNATMGALNIRKAEAKGKFLSFVQSAVDDATRAKGKPLGFDERQKIIDEAVLQGPDPDRFLPWGERRMFELTPEQRARFQPNAATDAPATEIEALNEALRAQGLAQTPANRLALYTRAMSKVAR